MTCLGWRSVKHFPTGSVKMAMGHHFCSICWGWQKLQHSLTPVLNRPDILIDPSGLLLVGSDLLLSKVDDYGWGLESVNKWILDGRNTITGPNTEYGWSCSNNSHHEHKEPYFSRKSERMRLLATWSWLRHLDSVSLVHQKKNKNRKNANSADNSNMRLRSQYLRSCHAGCRGGGAWNKVTRWKWSTSRSGQTHRAGGQQRRGHYGFCLDSTRTQPSKCYSSQLQRVWIVVRSKRQHWTQKPQ
jgi:hypothetical protein